jgi:hypothetical protein
MNRIGEVLGPQKSRDAMKDRVSNQDRPEQTLLGLDIGRQFARDRARPA